MSVITLDSLMITNEEGIQTYPDEGESSAGYKVSTEDFWRILRANRGLFSKTAKAIEEELKISYTRAAVEHRAKRCPEELRQIEEENIDCAEDAIRDCMNSLDERIKLDASKFYAKTKGKDRGYVERVQSDIIRDKSLAEVLEEIANENNTSSQSSIDGDTERTKSFELFEGQKMEAEQSL